MVITSRKTAQARHSSTAKTGRGRHASLRNPSGASRRSRTGKQVRVRHVARSHRLKAGGDAEYLAAVRNFEVAVRHFQKENYQRAAGIFQKLLSTPAHEIADRSRIHLRLCEQRMGQGESTPRTAEDHYLRGIAALNGRELDLALEHLGKSEKLLPKREHVHYALAAAYCLRGDSELALKYLASAIEMRSGNRMQARRDEDFQSLVDEPRFHQLLYPRLQ